MNDGDERPPLAPLLEVEALTKAFSSRAGSVLAVSDVTLAVAGGEVLLVTGPSGAGKTTLLTMIGGVLRPTSGRLTIAGQELTSLPEGQLTEVRRHLVGFIFQNFCLLNFLTTLENVEVALNFAGQRGPSARQRARELLEEFGMGGRLRFRPDVLSAGERQRVAVARALANNPKIVLADEPTANLDWPQAQSILALLRRIASDQKRAVVIVSHDPRVREFADSVLCLEDGRVAAQERLHAAMMQTSEP